MYIYIVKALKIKRLDEECKLDVRMEISVVYLASVYADVASILWYSGY